MKKSLILFLMLLCPCYAADKVHVEALEDYSSLKPKENFKVRVIEDGEMNDIPLLKGDIINCTLDKVKDPTRGKINARIYLFIDSYEDSIGVHKLEEKLSAKYAKTVINKEEIKKAPKKKYVKKAAGAVGSLFVKGFSYGVSFVDGVSTNEEGNRLKSGVKQVYDDSFLSLAELGEDVEINEGDTFYLVVKSAKDDDEDDVNRDDTGSDGAIKDNVSKENVEGEKS